MEDRSFLSNASQVTALSDDRARVVSFRLQLGGLVAIVFLLGILQFLAAPNELAKLYIIQRLYYIPVLLAGLTLGLRGGLILALIACAAFASGTPAIWTVSRVDVLDQCLEGAVICLVGGLSGALTDRHRIQQASLRRTANELSEAQTELKENFGRIARAERIYALAQLSAGLAHEIRTPLASLEGAASLVQKEAQTEERRREFLGIIQKESRRLNRLLTRFLEFARPRSPDWQRIEIGEILDSVILVVRHSGDTSQLELRKRIEPDLPMLSCDPEQLKQVLLNLVTNATQAMPHGGTVLLEAHSNGTSVHIDVHDQGSGIDKEEDLKRIFDPFFTTKESGTGLGLSIAHQIVSQHNGTLTITRNSPEGMTVRVSLPLQPGQL
jgi:two-component system, NtrC family, sensor histidine kinase HydH